MCLNFTDFDRSTGQNEPYQSKIFSENNTFPLLDTVYIDDFAKFRTRQASTCGCYCSFENYNANFSRKLPSTHLLGFSKTSTEYWTAVGHIMDEIKHLDGKEKIVSLLDCTFTILCKIALLDL